MNHATEPSWRKDSDDMLRRGLLTSPSGCDDLIPLLNVAVLLRSGEVAGTDVQAFVEEHRPD